MHPEEGLWLNILFPSSWLEKALFHWLSSIQTVFTQISTDSNKSRGRRPGRESNSVFHVSWIYHFWSRLVCPIHITGPAFGEISERERDIFYPSVFWFLCWNSQHCSSRFSGFKASVLTMIGSSAHLHEGAHQLSLAMPPSSPALCNSARARSLERQSGWFSLQVMEIPSHPQVTCSANELWEGREPFSQWYLCTMILHVAVVPTAVSKLPPGFHKHHLYTNIIQSNSVAGKFSSVR